ncbi:metalloregulator ArsR/SmtB family transcription factor [soil metagenome]
MQTDTLSPIFAALADPTRRAILESLTKGPMSVGDIARPFDMTGPAVTKHLKVLEKAGLIKTDIQAQWRPRTLNAERLHEAQEWIERYRQFWEESFDRLDDLLQKIQMEVKE